MDTPLFALQMRCFQLIGFRRTGDVRLQHAFRFYRLLCIISVLFCDVSQVIFLANNFDNVLAAAEVLSTLLTSIIVTSKCLSVYFQAEKFYKLISRAREISSEFLEETQLNQVKNIDRLVSSLYLSSCAFVSVSLCAGPIVFNLYKFFTNGIDYRTDFPFKVGFPFDASYSPAFEATYFILCLSSFVAIMISVSRNRKYSECNSLNCFRMAWMPASSV